MAKEERAMVDFSIFSIPPMYTYSMHFHISCADRSKMRILVIDDEQEILHLIRKSLMQTYDVDTCLRPDRELPANISEYDLIICDIMMPGEDGYTLVERIRNEVSCPILFLSAKSMEKDSIQGLAVGRG